MLTLHVLGWIGLKQDQTSNRFNSILKWLRTENGLVITDSLTHSLSYPKSRDAIASKNVSFMGSGQRGKQDTQTL